MPSNRSQILEFYKTVILPNASWDLLPFTFCQDLYKAWMTAHHPDDDIISDNRFNVALKLASCIDDEFTYIPGTKPTRAAKRMANTEHLVKQWDLTEWQDDGSKRNPKSAIGLIRSKTTNHTNYRLPEDYIIFCYQILDYLENNRAKHDWAMTKTPLENKQIKRWVTGQAIPTPEEYEQLNDMVEPIIGKHILQFDFKMAEQALAENACLSETCLPGDESPR